MLGAMDKPKPRAALVGLIVYLMAWGASLPRLRAPLESVAPLFVIGLLLFVGLVVWSMRRGTNA